MNKHFLLLGSIILGLSACGPVYVVHQDPPPPAPPVAAPAPEDVTYQAFYDQLSPYGQWIEMPDYGYVWLPDAGPDFKPYATNGHWIYTDEGWAWDSGYPWGWATFHYGRWFFQDGYGWMWMPGNEWAPAWVEWRNSDEYYGWAPLGPNISFSIAIGGGYTPPPHYWCFVPHQYVSSPQINNYYVRETNNVTIIHRTTIINNTTVINNGRNHHFGGPDPNDVGRFSGRPVRSTVIRDTRNPGDRGNGNDFAIYRPRVNANPPADNRPAGFTRPAPARPQTLNNARPVNRNSYGNNGNNNGWNGNNQGRNNNDDRDHNDRDHNNGGNNNNQPPRTSPGFSTNPNNQQSNNPPANNNPYVRPGAQPQPVNNPPASRPAWSQPANNQPTNNQQVNNPPANNPPANNPPAYNPPANNPPANNPRGNNPPANNNPYVRPGAQASDNPPANNPPRYNPPANNPPRNNPPANNPPGRNPAFSRPGAQPAQTQQNQGRPTGFERNNTPSARPAANPPVTATPQRVPPPPKKDEQKKDDQKRDNRP